MTLFATLDSETTDAIGLAGAVGDLFGGHSIGFSARVADVAARFAIRRERDPETIAASFFAGALHRIGAVRIVLAHDASPRSAAIAGWDEPPAGAAIVAAAGVFPAATADAVRWHREAFDGTGFPDQLRWNGIPETAMALNLARAFVLALEQSDAGSVPAAMFSLIAQSGSAFDPTALGEFREFLVAQADPREAPYVPAWVLHPSDLQRLIAAICDAIDGRQARTAGRGDRLERIVRAIVGRLPATTPIDPDRAAFAARLTALARTAPADDSLTLSHSGLATRAAQAATAARLLTSAESFAAFAPSVGSIEEWFDGSGLPEGRAGEAIDPLARVLAVALAADALAAAPADGRIAAAAGSRLDPAVVEAYRAGGPRR